MFLSLLLLNPAPAHRDCSPADPPVIQVHLIDNDDGGLRVLARHLGKQPGHTLDQPCLLFRGGALTGNPDVD